MDSNPNLHPIHHHPSSPIHYGPFERRRSDHHPNPDKPTNETPWCPTSPSTGIFIDDLALSAHLPLPLSARPFRFSFARELDTRARAAELVSKRYRWRGYGDECGHTLLNPHHSSQMTFIAIKASQLVGTVSARIDGNTPMNCESLYPDIVLEKRLQGQKLAEFGQLAIDASTAPLEIIGPLFHLTLIFTHHHHGASHALIEVNPRHVAFYRRVFGFRVIGEERHCQRVDAPAVLMQMNLYAASESILKSGGTRRGRTSVFPYCFSVTEYDAISKWFVN